jgi:UDP-GlcNAc:undecaprenyl-phosphate GlcNAc-1-phosphate transferase
VTPTVGLWVLPAVIGAFVAAVIAPPVAAAAHRYGITDKPRPPLKQHAEPVAYLGGLVVFVAFLIALAVTSAFDSRILAILLCGAIVVGVGLIDDLGNLSPRDKLVGQFFAAVVLVKSGVKVDILAVPFPFDELLSMLWMVTCMNAFNIVDVSDGLATTAGIAGALGSAVLAWLNDQPVVGTMSAALLGACVGFLRVNWQPARMYLGDTGSMFLGAMVGALALLGEYSRVNVVSAWFVPLCLGAVPLFDLTLVVIARLVARRPIYLGSPDHFAVRLRHHGHRAGKTASLSAVLALVVVAAGVASTRLSENGAAVVAALTASGLVGVLFFVFKRFPPKLPMPTTTTAP